VGALLEPSGVGASVVNAGKEGVEEEEDEIGVVLAAEEVNIWRTIFRCRPNCKVRRRISSDIPTSSVTHCVSSETVGPTA
jgi:hypothetical protein